MSDDIEKLKKDIEDLKSMQMTDEDREGLKELLISWNYTRRTGRVLLFLFNGLMAVGGAIAIGVQIMKGWK